MPYKTAKRQYTTMVRQGHAKSNEATHGHGHEKQQQDHTKSHKAT